MSGVKTSPVKSGPGSCGATDEPRYTEWLGKALGNPTAETRFVSASSQEACIQACDNAGNEQWCVTLYTQ